MSPVAGSPVSMFGGNITGVVKSATRPTSLVMSWRAPTWKEGHFGELEMSLQQGSTSTTLVLRLTGIPVGMEDASERNLNGYYINGLRSIGCAPSPTSPVLAPVELPKPSLLSLLCTTAIPMTISLGLIGGLIAVFYYGPSGPGRA